MNKFIDFFAVSSDKLKRTRILIREELNKRGWQAQVLFETSPQLFLTRPDGKELVIYSSTPPTTSHVSARLADDKLALNQLLMNYGFPQLETILITDNVEQDKALDFLNRHKRIVVKPRSSAHGIGVTINVDSQESLWAAIESAKIQSGSYEILLQQQYDSDHPNELRLLCINNKFVGAIFRQPARVYGDGIHSVKELIDLENRSSDRGRPYVSRLALIDTNRALQYLGEKAEIIPKENEEVRVMGVANYGAGGETISVTTQVPKWLISQAEEVSRKCQLPVVGIDYIFSGSLSKEALESDLKPRILEINKCPSLCIHDEPTDGKPQAAVKAFVDYLETL